MTAKKLLTDSIGRLEQLFPELVEIRRDLHMHPELSFQEERTPKIVAERLRSMGLEVRSEVGGRGVVGLLRGAQPGRTIALRADFDALPIHEENDVPYASRVPGVMHACGHDLHTAGLLGVAQVLSERREQLTGNVVFIHQFAEEVTPGGARSMVEDGCLEEVDAVFGAHVLSTQPYGTVGVCPGNAMAATDTFKVKITGRGGHGAMPHATADAVVLASQLVMNLQQIVSRHLNPLRPAVVTVGSLHAGTTHNVIPGTATLEGTVRTFDDTVRDEIESLMERIVRSTCDLAGATGDLNYVRGYPAVVNRPRETAIVERLARDLLGDDAVRQLEPIMGGEDFAYYLEKLPGTFFFVGGGNDETGMTFPHHHPRFDVDERSMLVAGKVFLATVLDFLAEPNPAEMVDSTG